VAPSVQCRKVWLTPTTRVPCSSVTKPILMRNPLKFAGVPQTTGPISVASGPKFNILWRHLEEILLLNIFPTVDMSLNCEDMARQIVRWCPRWWFFGEFLRPVFSASRVQHVSDLHLKFAVKPHHVWKYGTHPICYTPKIRRGKKKIEDRRNREAKI